MIDHFAITPAHLMTVGMTPTATLTPEFVTSGVKTWPKGHEPQILAYCSCGWESRVFTVGNAAEIAWQRHIEEAHPDA